MKLKNILIVVEDVEKSKKFYKQLFGLDVVSDFGENVILTEGLVLQQKKLWEKFIEQEVRNFGNDAELYFEENNMDSFLNKLEHSKYEINYVNQLIEHDWGQRVIRIYDLDGHVIEVGESLEFVARRLLQSGMTVEQTSSKCQLPVSWVEIIAEQLNNRNN